MNREIRTVPSQGELVSAWIGAVRKSWKYFKLENVLIGFGATGLFSAVMLTLDKFRLLENPEATLGCDLNPIVSCGSVINTWQASAFGFPNPILGLIGFSVVITIGMALKSGARFKKWFWQGLQGGAVFGILFVHWLMYQSMFNIKALCPFCMVVWASMIPLFVYITRYNINNKNIGNPFGKNLYQLKAFQVVIVWFLLVIGTILYQFWYYWETLLPL